MQSREYNRSSWEGGSASLLVNTALNRDAEADVCVVGAGIAGLTTAYAIAKSGRSVLVCDGGPVGGGETSRTTGHLSPVLGTRFYDLESIHGTQHTRIAAESHRSAIDYIEDIINDEQISCNFARVPGYLFGYTSQDSELLLREKGVCERIGITDVSFTHHTPVIEGQPSLQFLDQGQLHILAYIRGLAEAVQRHGGKIYSQTRVTNARGGASCTVETESGHRIRCKAVVIATNAPVIDNAFVFSRQATYRTYVIAAHIPKGSVKNILLWDVHDPYHYVRIQEDNDHDLLLVGGEDHRTGDRHNGTFRFVNLERWMRARFEMGGIAYRWSGQVMETIDGLTLIGPLPRGEENIFIATGDCGNGLTHGTIAGILLSSLVSGHAHPWAATYDPHRKRLKSVYAFTKENTVTTAAIVCDWLPGRRAKNPPVPGSGIVVKRGMQRIALYCDEQGGLHERSAVCPHKGCIVRWNAEEKSWDCPCHGSRFTCHGKVLCGPTLEDLPEIHEEHSSSTKSERTT